LLSEATARRSLLTVTRTPTFTVKLFRRHHMATEVIRDPTAEVPSTGVRLTSALIGGQLAGLAMAVLLFLVAGLALRVSPLFPVQLIASLLLGHDALAHASPGVLATGVLFHQLVPTLGWSLIFFASVMFIRERLDLNRALMLGFLIGLMSIIVDVYFIGPPLQELTSSENLWMKYLPRPWDWAAHMFFGLSLGYAYWAVRNRIEARRGLVRRIHVPTTVSADEQGVTRTKDGHQKRID
jgi:hypothetical protein